MLHKIGKQILQFTFLVTHKEGYTLPTVTYIAYVLLKMLTSLFLSISLAQTYTWLGPQGSPD